MRTFGRTKLLALAVLSSCSVAAAACGASDLVPAPDDAVDGAVDGAVDAAVVVTDAGPFEGVDGGVGGPADAGEGTPAMPPPPPPGPPGPPGPSRLSIGTWNLQSFPKSAGTVDAVRALVEANDLDLVGIQEITDPAPFAALADALPEHDMVVSFDARTYTRVGFLYRPTRIVVGEVDRLFTSDRSAFPRSPLVAELAVLDEAGAVVFDFTFVVVHLKAMVDEESRLRRVDAVQKLDEWMRARAATGDPDIVVVGDFNDELTDAPAWNVFTPFLDAPELYRFLDYDTERSGAYSYIPFRAMIDHVLVTTDALGEYGRGHVEVLALERRTPGYEDEVSDHRPVVAHFELPALGAGPGGRDAGASP